MKPSAILAALVVAAGCVSAGTQVIISSSSGQVSVAAEIADSPAEWQRGLMLRENLGENGGMLFAFPDSQRRSFWMKDTLIPLDILFISENFRVSEITTLQPCEADPCPSYLSSEPAKYVLEVNAGFAGRNNITAGSSVAFSFSG